MKNLQIKFLIILGVLLACVYGIVGIPWPVSKIQENWNNNIKLGLDLKGGSQLVMQVQVQDAFRAEAAAQADRLREALAKKAIEFAVIDLTDAKSIDDAENTAILVKGVPATKAGDFRQTAIDTIGGAWDMASVGQND